LRLRYTALLLLFTCISPASAYTYEMTWSYTNQGTETYYMSMKDRGVPVFPDTGYQTITMETSLNDTILLMLERDYLKIISSQPVQVHAGETYSIQATYQITSKQRQAPVISKDDSGTMTQIPEALLNYTVANALYPVDNREIIELAEELASGEETVYGKVLDILEWFEDNSTYTVTELPRRPEYLVRDPRGDCDDLALLFITMCRSLGIPAYLQGGVVLSDTLMIDETDWDGHYRYVFDGAGWHAWAMVYVPPWGWLPVDLTKLGGFEASMAITDAYYWRESTIIAWNITSHDYIQDEVNQREALTASNVVFTQVDKMIVEEKVGPPYLLYAAAILLAALFFTVWFRNFRS
jgi:hypothetical protein